MHNWAIVNMYFRFCYSKEKDLSCLNECAGWAESLMCVSALYNMPFYVNAFHLLLGPRFVVQIGEKTIDYNEEFRLFLTTRNPAPEIPPDAASVVTEVNFTTTKAGLTGQVKQFNLYNTDLGLWVYTHLLTFFYAPTCAKGSSGAYSILPWCYVRTCVHAYVHMSHLLWESNKCLNLNSYLHWHLRLHFSWRS